MSVSIEINDGIAIVTVDSPPVNALSQSVRGGLLSAIEATESNPAVRAVVLRCEGRTFIAGADVREFGQEPKEPHLPDVISQLEQTTKPWVAAIHGTALGGGVEVVLGCHYRIAAQEAKLGFPEVMLGLIPGGGGTVRLPRLIGAIAALDMISGGKPVSASKALEIGLIDAIATANLDQSAVDLARKALSAALPKALSLREVSVASDQKGWIAAKQNIRSKAREQTAVLAAVDAVDNATFLPVAEALIAERERFLALRDGPQSAALRYLFAAERSATKIPALKGVAPRAVEKIGVIGGGMMGAGIAAACLLSGLCVTMIEWDDASLSTGLERVRTTLEDSEKRGLISAMQKDVMLANLAGDTDYNALSAADLVIEAVFESMDVKKEVFAALDRVTRKDTVLATNTSYLDINALAATIEHPSRVIGLHFFSPAHVMKLLEIVVPDQASPEVIATGFALGKRLKKTTVPAGVCDGFIGNRIMSAYRRECDYMLEDGALPHQIDAVMRAFGFRMGVFQMQDLAGLDIAWAMRKQQAATRPEGMRYVDIADRLCENRHFGRKTGRGWYDYRTDKAGAIAPEVIELIMSESTRKGIERTEFTEAQLIARILNAMQREGEKVLGEGIARSAEAIDVVMINGYGFPRWMGGPMYLRSI